MRLFSFLARYVVYLCMPLLAFSIVLDLVIVPLESQWTFPAVARLTTPENAKCTIDRLLEARRRHTVRAVADLRCETQDGVVTKLAAVRDPVDGKLPAQDSVIPARYRRVMGVNLISTPYDDYSSLEFCLMFFLMACVALSPVFPLRWSPLIAGLQRSSTHPRWSKLTERQLAFRVLGVAFFTAAATGLVLSACRWAGRLVGIDLFGHLIKYQLPIMSLLTLMPMLFWSLPLILVNRRWGDLTAMQRRAFQAFGILLIVLIMITVLSLG